MPVFDPTRWNTFPTIATNNCYNYALDRRDGQFLHPGELSRLGKLVPRDFCNGLLISDRAEQDGLRPIAVPEDARVPDEWAVALVIAPRQWLVADGDFHWYRRDDDGSWSHKPGRGPATNVDHLNHRIVDPIGCHDAFYVSFVGYFAAKIMHRP